MVSCTGKKVALLKLTASKVSNVTFGPFVNVEIVRCHRMQKGVDLMQWFVAKI